MNERIARLAKISGAADDACRQAKLSAQARALMRPGGAIEELLGALIAVGLLRDAVSVMAYALPKREAVWWACLAVRAMVDSATPPAALAALEAAEAWVFQPSDARRRAAMQQAQASGFDHAAVWPAVAAFWSGGSMAPPELPAVPPAEHLTGLAVDGAVTLAAVAREPERAPERLRGFLDQAFDIANGGSGRLKTAS